MEFCQNNNRIQAENVLTEADAFFQMSDHLGNRHIYGTYRLKIFVHLSKTRGQDSLELDLQRLDSSFGSGLTTRSSGGIGAAAMFTPLSISTSAASVSPSTSASSYRFRAIATDSGVQVMENATLSDSGCPRTPMLGSISIDTTYSNGEVSIFSDLSGFGGQRPDAEEGYFLGDLPGTPTMGQQHQHHQQHQKQHRFDGGFSPSTSRSRAMPPTQQPSLGYLQARDQGKLIAFSPQQASFSPRASPAGAYGKTSLLSSQARPFSPHTHQSLYMGSPPQYGQRQQQQAATGREQPAPFPSQSRYQPALQHQASPLHRAAPPVPLPPLPRSFASSTAGPVLSSGGRYHIVPPEPSQVPSVPITAPCIGDADAPHSVRSYDGGTYVITPPTQESAPSSWVAPSDQSSRQLQQRSTPVAPVTRNSPPGQRGEQASRLVDDATTLANTRANFHVSLSPTTEFSASISAITSPSPKNTKTVMWADQAATATVEEELEDPSDTSSISAGSEHGEASSQEFDILQQAVDLEASSTEEEDWQFPSCLLASSSAPAATARNTSCSWTLQDNDDEDFRVDLLGDLQYEDAGDETEDVLADVAGSSLLYTVSAGPSSEREQVLRPASWRDSVLTEEATPLPSWLSAGSPFTGTVGEASRTANLHLGSGHLVLSNIDAGDESDDSYYPLLSLTSLATLTSLSLSPIKETASAEGNTESNHSGENSPISPHFGAWPAPGVEKASSGKEKLFAH